MALICIILNIQIKVNIMQTTKDFNKIKNTDTTSDLIRNYGRVFMVKPHSCLKQIYEFYQKHGIANFLKVCGYEKYCPYNLWFRHPDYQIKYHVQMKQVLRVRYYKGYLLTPLMLPDYPSLDHLGEVINHMTIYQPYYPLTFYQTWDLLNADPTIDLSSLFYVGYETNLGTVEAMLLYNDRKTNHKGICDILIISTEEEHYECINLDNYVSHRKIPNLLGQNYQNVNLLRNTNKISENKYETIIIDTISPWISVDGKWAEIYDFLITIKSAINVFNNLSENGTLIVRMNIFGSDLWELLFESIQFTEFFFHRSKIVHPFDGSIFLILKKKGKILFDKLDKIIDIYLTIYAYKYCRLRLNNFNFHKNNSKCNENTNTVVYINYQSIKNKYAGIQSKFYNSVNKILAGYSPTASLEDNFVDLPLVGEIINLPHIKCISLQTQLNKSPQDKKKINQSIIIKLNYSSRWKNKQSYIKLINDSCELNFTKRALDTKPSSIMLCPNKEENYFRGKKQEETFMTWDQLVRLTNYYKYLRTTLHKDYGAEIVTNAWFKMYEILTAFPQFAETDGVLNTFHICEAPGGFVSALNHYLRSNFPKTKWNWHAQSLIPKSMSNMALDDHYGLIQAYPDNWLMNGCIKNNTGDITNVFILRQYQELFTKQSSEVNFMTADGGIFCPSTQLNDQEKICYKLFLGEAICILSCLKLGGSAVMKLFLPMIEPLTVSIVCLMFQSFENLYLFKPPSSHSYNSEVYLVMINYQKLPEENIKLLLTILSNPKISPSTQIVDLDLAPNGFLAAYLQTIGKFIGNQIIELKKQYVLYYDPIRISSIQKDIQTFQYEWLDKHRPVILDNKLL